MPPSCKPVHECRELTDWNIRSILLEPGREASRSRDGWGSCSTQTKNWNEMRTKWSMTRRNKISAQEWNIRVFLMYRTALQKIGFCRVCSNDIILRAVGLPDAKNIDEEDADEKIESESLSWQTPLVIGRPFSILMRARCIKLDWRYVCKTVMGWDVIKCTNGSMFDMVSTQLPDTFWCFCSNYCGSMSMKRIEYGLLTFWSESVGLWPDKYISQRLLKALCLFADITKYFGKSILADVAHAPDT